MQNLVVRSQVQNKQPENERLDFSLFAKLLRRFNNHLDIWRHHFF